MEVNNKETIESTEVSGVIPEGYLQNASGHLVPKKMVKEIDLVRDGLVREIVAKAQETQKNLQDFKLKAFADLTAFVELASEKYGIQKGGAKGNVSFVSFDGQLKIQIAVSEHMIFDERLRAAKSLVDQYIHNLAEKSDAEVKALLEHAFQTDKEGHISISRVLGLTQLNIDDPVWKRGMEALRDSMQIAGSTTYMRLYKRDETGKYQQIPLDLSAV